MVEAGEVDVIADAVDADEGDGREGQGQAGGDHAKGGPRPAPGEHEQGEGHKDRLEGQEAEQETGKHLSPVARLRGVTVRRPQEHDGDRHRQQ